MSYGAGAAEGLQDVLARLHLQAQLRQRMREAEMQAESQRRSQDITMRGQDITTRGQDQVQSRFETTRADALAANEAAAAKEAADAAALDQFVGTLPEHLRPVVMAKGRFGVQIAPDDLVNAPMTREEAQKFKVRGIADETRAREEVQHGFRMRELEAQHQNAVKLANMRQPSGTAQTSTYVDDRNQRISDVVDELDQQVSPFTTGAGSLLSFFPGTSARDFAAKLNTLKSNIAFGELAEMRAASKTGGALGAVSERELALLESSRGALDAAQSPAAFRAELKKIKDSLTRWEQAKQQFGGGAAVPPAQGTGGGAVEYDYVPGKGLVPRGGQ